MAKRALIIGAHGQDGAYLAQHLLGLGYEVYGGTRRTSSGGPWRLMKLGILSKVVPICMDVLDLHSVRAAVATARPDEIYNLAAQGHVGDSWSVPGYTLAVNAEGANNVFLSAGDARVFQASTLDIFAGQPCPEGGYDEASEIHPATPYGVSKAAAQFSAEMHRSKGRFIACGIMGNHESPLRQDTFVTQKIAKGVKRWRETGEPFELYNVSGVRDWGWAPEYVDAMHLMLLKDEPEDFVLATGVEANVLEFLGAAVGTEKFGIAYGLGTPWKSGDVDVVCRVLNRDDNKMQHCFGNPAKANERLNWVPQVRWAEIARRMVEAA